LKAATLALCLAALTAQPLPAAAAKPGTALTDTVNWVRQRGCKAPVAPAVLREDPKLDKAAARLAGGGALREALTAEGYVASESAVLHLSGAINDAQISHMLAAAYCRSLTDPKFREIGALRRGAEVWLLIAAPVAIPAAADADGVSRHILDLVNAARAAGRRCGSKSFPPAPPLTLSSSLAAAALAHSRDMARFGGFDHRGHDGSNPALRVERAGYGAHRIVGENIAAGAMSPAEATAGWLASPAHCENIMDARFTQMGVAFALNLKSSQALFWTQDFAAPP
jgi:uncharacterized protein YkwD